jgi:flagellar basal-body rod protein FlgG
MIYGMYLSATGVLANSFRQDVIANNMANAETAGFKKDLTLFQEQRTEAQRRGLSVRRYSNEMLEGLGGGLAISQTAVDMTPGDIETTDNSKDVAIDGNGFFAVRDKGQTKLTRDGRFLIDREGYLALVTGGQRVLNDKQQPIQLGAGPMAVAKDGTISRDQKAIGRIGQYDVPNRLMLTKRGRGLMDYPNIERSLRPMAGTMLGGATERSNVAPETELTALMDAQRQLEANANMIRYQDQTLSRLVNDVGKIS